MSVTTDLIQRARAQGGHMEPELPDLRELRAMARRERQDESTFEGKRVRLAALLDNDLIDPDRRSELRVQWIELHMKRARREQGRRAHAERVQSRVAAVTRTATRGRAVHSHASHGGSGSSSSSGTGESDSGDSDPDPEPESPPTPSAAPAAAVASSGTSAHSTTPTLEDAESLRKRLRGRELRVDVAAAWLVLAENPNADMETLAERARTATNAGSRETHAGGVGMDVNGSPALPIPRLEFAGDSQKPGVMRDGERRLIFAAAVPAPPAAEFSDPVFEAITAEGRAQLEQRESAAERRLLSTLPAHLRALAAELVRHGGTRADGGDLIPEIAARLGIPEPTAYGHRNELRATLRGTVEDAVLGARWQPDLFGFDDGDGFQPEGV